MQRLKKVAERNFLSRVSSTVCFCPGMFEKIRQDLNFFFQGFKLLTYKTQRSALRSFKVIKVKQGVKHFPVKPIKIRLHDDTSKKFLVFSQSCLESKLFDAHEIDGFQRMNRWAAWRPFSGGSCRTVCSSAENRSQASFQKEIIAKHSVKSPTLQVPFLASTKPFLSKSFRKRYCLARISSLMTWKVKSEKKNLNLKSWRFQVQRSQVATSNGEASVRGLYEEQPVSSRLPNREILSQLTADSLDRCKRVE